MTSEEELRRKAEKRAEEKIGFFIHFTVYVMVNIFFVFIWWLNYAETSTPWFLFITIGWGIGIAVHFVAVFVGIGYKDKLVKKELEKLKK